MAYKKKIPVDLDCPLRLTQSLIGAKWKPCILDELRHAQCLRPSELCRRLPDAPARVLAIQLKELVEDGLVQKRQISECPPHSEYSLTRIGESLLPLIDNMIRWGKVNFDLFMKKNSVCSSPEGQISQFKGEKNA